MMTVTSTYLDACPSGWVETAPDSDRHWSQFSIVRVLNPSVVSRIYDHNGKLLAVIRGEGTRAWGCRTVVCYPDDDCV